VKCGPCHNLPNPQAKEYERGKDTTGPLLPHLRSDLSQKRFKGPQKFHGFIRKGEIDQHSAGIIQINTARSSIFPTSLDHHEV
jgi:hypothetical protein